MRHLVLTISIITFLGLAFPLSAAPRHTGGGQSFGTGSGGRVSSAGAIAPGAPLSVRAILGSPRVNALLIGGYGYPALFRRVRLPGVSGGYGYPAVSGRIPPANFSGGTGPCAARRGCPVAGYSESWRNDPLHFPWLSIRSRETCPCPTKLACKSST